MYLELCYCVWGSENALRRLCCKLCSFFILHLRKQFVKPLNHLKKHIANEYM